MPGGDYKKHRNDTVEISECIGYTYVSGLRVGGWGMKLDDGEERRGCSLRKETGEGRDEEQQVASRIRGCQAERRRESGSRRSVLISL